MLKLFLSVGKADRNVLPADVNAFLGLMTCERDGVGKIARLSLQRSCALVVPGSCLPCLSETVEHAV